MGIYGQNHEYVARYYGMGSGITELPVMVFAGCAEGRSTSGLHVHRDSEFIMVLEGENTVRVGDLELYGFPGRLIMTPGDRPHEQIHDVFSRRIYVIFSADPLLCDDSPRTIDYGQDPWLPRWVQDIYELSHAIQPTPPAAMNALLLAVLSRLRQIQTLDDSLKSFHPAVRRALRIIARRLADPLSLDDLARESGVSASHLVALFNEALSMAPMTYWRSQRMAFARRLLRDPHRPVSQIAGQCGYEDANYFTRLFQKENGETPSAFRRRHVR